MEIIKNSSRFDLFGQQGLSMIEVLIALFIVAFGLLGIAAFQSRLQTAEMEAYQRSQAFILLQDMVNRISSNKPEYAPNYVTTSPLGVGDSPAINCSTLPTQAERDLCEWSHLLQGAAEQAGTTRVGAMIGARGCIEPEPGGSGGGYVITIAWQGLTPQQAPSADITCGAGLYDGGVCTGDLCRRVIRTTLLIK